ncbi:MAG: hypothetical protein IH984_03380 [Planctomycetes bacterium]|nr:hypothetical protein [Planctomycetota bacterium]
MAQGVRHICGGCGHAIEAWSDGNPYYIDKAGDKQYAYHPDHELLAKCIGNDSPHLCLSCGFEFMVDSNDPVANCPKCKTGEIACTYDLDNKQCPFCKEGVFNIDPDLFAIS